MSDQISHPELVRKLFKDPRTIHLSPEQVNLLHAAVGLAGEAGEVLDRVKKLAFNGNDAYFRQQMINELGDLEFYAEALRQSLGVTRQQTLDANTAKLSTRYQGLEYSDEAAAARADEA
jgi:NTP pyrophosphatase (non-canonical NTP hydrolase)